MYSFQPALDPTQHTILHSTPPYALPPRALVATPRGGRTPLLLGALIRLVQYLLEIIIVRVYVGLIAVLLLVPIL